jgi:hypothetical protein
VPLGSPREKEKPYPVNALPQILRDAVVEYAEYGQQPAPLIASSALASLSLAAQGLADVARDEHLRGPISLYFLNIAVSGERKTSADNWFRGPIHAWMLARRDLMQDEVAAGEALSAAWKAERDGLLAKIKSARGKGDDAGVEQLRENLIKLEQGKPREIIVPKLFYEDSNAPALAIDLAEGWPSASLWSDEAGLVVGAHGMSDDVAMGYVGLLNRLWDGTPFDRDRASAKRARIQGRRFTVNLMMQPLVMARLLSLAGGASRGMGLIARFLLSWPASTIGTRVYRQPPRDVPAIGRLRRRLNELLDLPLPLDPENPTIMALAPPRLRFTARAQRLWEQFHNDVEVELGKTGEFADIADIGAKTAENAARMAGGFHVAEHGPTGEINSKTLFRATRVVLWHLNDARRVLATFERPESLTDAETLLEWLLRQPATDPPASIDPRHILQFGPRSLGRGVKRRDTAIEILVEHNHLRVAPKAISGRGAKRYVLNPRISA